MHYVDNDSIREEQVQFVEDNERYPPVRSWLNLNCSYKIEVVQVENRYYIKVFFSPKEYYYIASFDNVKDANGCVVFLLDSLK